MPQPTRRLAVVMDPIQDSKPAKDSTLAVVKAKHLVGAGVEAAYWFAEHFGITL